MTAAVRAVDRYTYALEQWYASEQDSSRKARRAWNRLQHAQRELERFRR